MNPGILYDLYINIYYRSHRSHRFHLRVHPAPAIPTTKGLVEKVFNGEGQGVQRQGLQSDIHLLGEKIKPEALVTRFFAKRNTTPFYITIFQFGSWIYDINHHISYMIQNWLSHVPSPNFGSWGSLASRRQRHAPLEALADAGPHPATALEEKEKALYGRQVLGCGSHFNHGFPQRVSWLGWFGGTLRLGKWELNKQLRDSATKIGIEATKE